MRENIPMTIKDEFLKNVNLLIQTHSEGHLGGEVMPEDVLLGIVPVEELMNVLTLGMSLNYQRNSYSLWNSIVQVFYFVYFYKFTHYTVVRRCHLS